MKLLLASSIDSEAVELLRRTHDVVCAFGAKEEELCAQIADRDVLVFRSGVEISSRVLASAPDLKLIVRAGSGLDNIDMGYVRRHGLRLERVFQPGAQAVAEMAFALMLGLARQVTRADRLLRRGHWAKNSIEGFLLQGKTLGIVGAGNIGSTVGRLGAAWGMTAIGCVEHPKPDVADVLGRQNIQLVAFETVLEEADFLTIHVPRQPSTLDLIGPAELGRMKPGAFLINLARGGVVDEHALYDALTTGTLGGAALDVHAREGEGHISPLAALDNVILTPHIGAMTIDSQREIGRQVIEIIDQFAALGADEPSAVLSAV